MVSTRAPRSTHDDRGLAERVQLLVNRSLHIGILGALLAGLRRRDPSVVTNGVVSLAFAAIPGRLESALGVRFRPWQRLWISASALVHTLGMLGPYDRVWWWDHLAHALSGVIVAATADVVYRTERSSRWRGSFPFDSRAAWVAGVTVGFGLVWELLEYGSHAVAERMGFEPLLVHYGRFDTIADVAFDLLGAGLVLLLGKSTLSNLTDPAGDDPRTGETR